MGVRHFTPAQSELSVKTFREAFSEVKDYWYAIERAAIKCVEEKRPTKAGPVSFDLKGSFLRMLLPSGRYLHYFNPKVDPVKMPWKDDRGGPVWKDSLTYEGVDDRKQWVTINTHPGKLTENADQAISRDLLVHGMRLARWNHGLDIRLHVHDQNLALASEAEGSEALEILKECMETPPEWAEGLPLGSAGFLSKVFKKD
jgi:DNA polymerase